MADSNHSHAMESMVKNLPPDVEVRSEGESEERKVVLDIEGTTFHLHPDDARVIGECLVLAAVEAAENDGDEP